MQMKYLSISPLFTLYLYIDSDRFLLVVVRINRNDKLIPMRHEMQPKRILIILFYSNDEYIYKNKYVCKHTRLYHYYYRINVLMKKKNK